MQFVPRCKESSGHCVRAATLAGFAMHVPKEDPLSRGSADTTRGAEQLLPLFSAPSFICTTREPSPATRRVGDLVYELYACPFIVGTSAESRAELFSTAAPRPWRPAARGCSPRSPPG